MLVTHALAARIGPRSLLERLERAPTDLALRSSRFDAAGSVRGTFRTALRSAVVALLAVLLTGACGLVSGEGPNGDERNLIPLPELSKKSRAERRRPDAPWTYVLPVDHGVREDGSGKGHFRAPRFHGEHNGIDLLAPVGTATFAACEGRAIAGVSRSFGNWVRVICPVPDSYMARGGPRPWASFFYAHLDRVDLPLGEWADVSLGQQVGAVGKTGNARGTNIQPHLHLELIVQTNRRSAMDENHLGNDQSTVGAASYFASSLQRECLEPLGFRPLSSELSRARRIDPFVALTCLGQQKPDFQRPVGEMRRSSLPWDRYYEATNFNVNLGPEDHTLATR